MKYGIYYAYWEDQWKADYFKYIEKVAKLGFDFLEIACTPINGYSRQTLKDLRQAAKDNGIESVGVAWGYVKPEELALADRIAATPAEI